MPLSCFTALSKKLLSTSATSFSLEIMLFLSIKVICDDLVPLSDKNGLTVFQNILLSVISFKFKLL